MLKIHKPVQVICQILFISTFCSMNTVSADSLWDKYAQNGAVNTNLPDYSYAGFFSMDVKDDADDQDIFNVLEYGAIPDDDIDDSQAIQQAIDNASDNGGGIVFIPKGQYQIKGGTEDQILKITTSNITLRGEGAEGDNATVLYLENPSDGAELGLIGTSQSDLRSIAALAIEGTPDSSVLAVFADQDFVRGTRIITVDSTVNLHPDQTIRVQLTDPLVDTENPNKENIDLIKSLTYPFEFTGEETNTFGKYGKVIEYVTKIRKVIDEKSIELYQPLRFDHLTRYSPTVVAFNGISNIGVENIRFESAWQGQYIHHQAYPGDAIDESDIIRTASEQDYGWVAIWGTWMSESWIQNVVFDNYTQNIILSNSAFSNVEDIVLKGTGGHAGLTYASVYSILTQRVLFEGRYAHPLSIRAWTSGSVFSDLSILDSTFNDADKTGPFIDFHGLFPYENLFENMQGFYVHSGGDLNVMPHSGIRNTLWNIQTPNVINRFDYAINEFFNTAATSVTKMYQYYPSSFVIGVYADSEIEVLINKSAENRVDEFVSIESLNSLAIPFESLYQKQVELRKQQYPLPPQAPMLLE